MSTSVFGRDSGSPGLSIVLFPLCGFVLLSALLSMRFCRVLLAFLVTHATVPFCCHLRRFAVCVSFSSASEVLHFSGGVIDSNSEMVAKISNRFATVMDPPDVGLWIKPGTATSIEPQIKRIMLRSLQLSECVCHLEDLCLRQASRMRFRAWSRTAAKEQGEAK